MHPKGGGKNWILANDQSPHLSLAGVARARGRHRPRTAAPRADTPVHGRRVPAAAATVTAISAISLLQETGGRGSNPIQYRNPSGQETGSGRMRRRCYKGEGEGEGDGIMTRMSAAVAAALSIGWGAGMGGGLVLSSLLFPPPHLKLPPRDIYICIPHSISTPLSSHRGKKTLLFFVWCPFLT